MRRTPLTVLDVDITAERAYRELLEAIDPAQLPDAFFAENDVVAAAAIRALTAKGDLRAGRRIGDGL